MVQGKQATLLGMGKVMEAATSLLLFVTLGRKVRPGIGWRLGRELVGSASGYSTKPRKPVVSNPGLAWAACLPQAYSFTF